MESPRIAELRRRLEADPASIVFAQLAEEHRRLGEFVEAERICRTGLARHPTYLSARVTLGRTLLELGHTDQAARELERVIAVAPDNLAALRALAELQHRQGNLAAALDYYKRARLLAPDDRELDMAIDFLESEMPTGAALPDQTHPAPASVQQGTRHHESLPKWESRNASHHDVVDRLLLVELEAWLTAVTR